MSDIFICASVFTHLLVKLMLCAVIFYYFILSLHFGIELFSVLRLNYVRTFTSVDFYIMLSVLQCIFKYVNVQRFDWCLMVVVGFIVV